MQVFLDGTFSTPGGALQGVLSTKGDLLGFDTAPARVPAGEDLSILAADSSRTLGLAYYAQLVLLMQELKGFWRLEEAAGAKALDSISLNDLTPSASPPTSVSGIRGNGLLFTAASSQNLEISDAVQVGLNPGVKDLALSVWFFPIGVTGAGVYYLIGKGATGGPPNAEGYSVFIYGQAAAQSLRLGVWLGDSVGALVGCQMITADQCVLNSWNHLYAYFDRDDALHLFLNGVPQTAAFGSSSDIDAFASTTASCASPAAFRLGSYSQVAGGAASFYDGRLDAVGVWVHQATVPDIAARAAALYVGGRGLELFPLWTTRGLAGSDLPLVNRRPPANVTIPDGYAVAVPGYYDLSASGVTLDLQGDAALEIL